jgi:hypothetical protein
MSEFTKFAINREGRQVLKRKSKNNHAFLKKRYSDDDEPNDKVDFNDKPIEN